MARASELLDIARGELGAREAPAESNRVKYNAWYYGREVAGAAYPWCMVFVQWCFAQAEAAALLPARTASCGALMRAAQRAGCWVAKDFRPGDVVLYDFPGGGATDHCGIVESASANGVVDIEGNTGTSSDADGGQVQRRERPARYIVGAVRPRYEEEDTMDNIPSNYAREAVTWAQRAGIL